MYLPRLDRRYFPFYEGLMQYAAGIRRQPPQPRQADDPQMPADLIFYYNTPYNLFETGLPAERALYFRACACRRGLTGQEAEKFVEEEREDKAHESAECGEDPEHDNEQGIHDEAVRGDPRMEKGIDVFCDGVAPGALKGVRQQHVHEERNGNADKRAENRAEKEKLLGPSPVFHELPYRRMPEKKNALKKSINSADIICDLDECSVSAE
jgi:hypothetical protein